MSDARAQILDSLRKSLKRGPDTSAIEAEIDSRIGTPKSGLIPEQTRGSHDQHVAQFVTKAEAVAATVVRVERLDQVPQAIAQYLTGRNLSAEVAVTGDDLLAAVPWAEASMLTVAHRTPSKDDQVGITPVFAGIAETGSMMMASGPAHPTSANFLPETHIAVLPASRIVGSLDDGLARWRATGKPMPRTISFVTGPSRTGDLELTIELGVHGPRNVHIIVVDDDTVD